MTLLIEFESDSVLSGGHTGECVGPVSEKELEDERIL